MTTQMYVTLTSSNVGLDDSNILVVSQYVLSPLGEMHSIVG